MRLCDDRAGILVMDGMSGGDEQMLKLMDDQTAVRHMGTVMHTLAFELDLKLKVANNQWSSQGTSSALIQACLNDCRRASRVRIYWMTLRAIYFGELLF